MLPHGLLITANNNDLTVEGSVAVKNLHTLFHISYLHLFFLFFIYFFIILFYFLTLQYCIGFAIVQVRCTILDAWGWCTGTTQRDGMGREDGGGFRMGNTCIPVADSF